MRKETNEPEKTKSTQSKDVKKTKTTSTKSSKSSTSQKKSPQTTSKKSTKSTSKKVSSKSKKTPAPVSKEIKKEKKDTKKKKEKETKIEIEPVTTPIPEYYDLPQKYNKTIVKILAQTPKTLFIYWEISDDDIKKYKNQYGENFFEVTKPVLIVHNDTLNYSFEVEINDFANSWYLHVNDSKSDYRIELGRRPIYNNQNIKNNYVYISKSNEIESPNDHILFNNSQKTINFRNVKTHQEIQKPVSKLFFKENMGKIYNVYDLYQELYKNEDDLENLANPSSNTSSKF